ncbi:hypothetical protein D0Z00_002024 [Geotrichum galactomycetum]|uniref:Uncharacterized protein n=1 Tax=Geotrichum galactomycetum TaxID=27317 RepID=A0ACB6V5A1_9ASCO|nr:hypothetical protein D0Z00_002024 [Geotrichum candidum]
MISDIFNHASIYQIVLVLGLVVAAAYQVIQYQIRTRALRLEKQKIKELYGDEDFKIKIKSVANDFDWTQENPRAYRPFKKGPYNLTMGIKNITDEDWLLIENTYLKSTNERQEIVEDDYKSKKTLISHPDGAEGVYEFYDIAIDYMMQRYPMYFYEKPNEPGYVYNAIRNESIFKTSSQYNGNRMLLIKTLSRHLEEDFLIMKKSDKNDEYYLRGGAFVFPSGLDPSAKANLSLKDIHGPVPYYKEKIEKSMDKFFQRLKIGKFVMRINWTCQAHTQRYAVGMNHAYNNVEKPEVLKAENLDFENGVFLRNERQCLMRLPKSKAIVFTIRTYLTPIAQVKREGETGLDLASAIENLPPATRIYKTATVWGDAIIDYMRNY